MTKCPYCDFASFAVGRDFDEDKQQQKNLYLSTLRDEIEARLDFWFYTEPLRTVFFGGGTPSMHSADELFAILELLRSRLGFDSDVEITLEANPGTVSASKLREFREAGINRISLGVQSFDASLLEKLGRGHSIDETLAALTNIKDAGFKSWSLDLIYGLPRQDLGSFAKTVEQALSFDPPHLSSYALSIETNTPYGEIYVNSQHTDLPQEEILVEMYQYLHQALGSRGLERYEISNWAKPGHEAQHNLTYWRAQPYYAFGLSAHGYVAGRRYANTRDLFEYLQGAWDHGGGDLISSTEAAGERIMLGLRLAEGLELDRQVEQALNLDKIEELESLALISRENNKIKLSTEGMLVSNAVLAQLIA